MSPEQEFVNHFGRSSSATYASGSRIDSGSSLARRTNSSTQGGQQK